MVPLEELSLKLTIDFLLLDMQKINAHTFQHDSDKIIFFDTFLQKGKIHYLIQCENKKGYVGECNVTFKKNWEGL